LWISQRKKQMRRISMIFHFACLVFSYTLLALLTMNMHVQAACSTYTYKYAFVVSYFCPNLNHCINNILFGYLAVISYRSHPSHFGDLLKESVRKSMLSFNVHEEYGREHIIIQLIYTISLKDIFTVRLKVTECPTRKTDNKTIESVS
jgi:hypothetical protein